MNKAISKLNVNRVRSASPGRLVSLLAAIFALALLLPGLAGAQSFDGARFLDQCLRLEAGGDYVSARESCLNALELDPGNTDTLLALARLEIRLGELNSAENRLLPLQSRVTTAEPALLLAELALERDDLVLAEGYLDTASRQLASNQNSEHSARQAWLLGRTLEMRGEPQEALGQYRRATDAQPLEEAYWQSAASVLLGMGLPVAAADELLQYRTTSGQRGSADLHSLLGQSLWASGRLQAAATEYEAAFALRAGRDAEAQAADLRSLTTIYYGLGDTAGGNAALGDAIRQGNLVRLLSGNALMWLLVLLLLAAVHLISESRIQDHQTLQSAEGPRLWSITRIYSVLIISALLALVAVLLYSALVLQNYTAMFTPLQAGQVKSIFVIVFVISAVLASWIIVRKHGWNPRERLLGRSDHAVTGLGLGLILLVLVTAWQFFVPTGLLRSDWHFDLRNVDAVALAAILLLPLGELYFRSFSIPALEKRYSGNLAVPISAGLYALVLGTPVILSIVLGLILGYAFLRVRSGLMVVTAQLVLQLGLVLLHMLWSGFAATFV